eukprot:g5447.t1
MYEAVVCHFLAEFNILEARSVAKRMRRSGLKLCPDLKLELAPRNVIENRKQLRVNQPANDIMMTENDVRLKYPHGSKLLDELREKKLDLWLRSGPVGRQRAQLLLSRLASNGLATSKHYNIYLNASRTEVDSLQFLQQLQNRKISLETSTLSHFRMLGVNIDKYGYQSSVEVNLNDDDFSTKSSKFLASLLNTSDFDPRGILFFSKLVANGVANTALCNTVLKSLDGIPALELFLRMGGGSSLSLKSSLRFWDQTKEDVKKHENVDGLVSATRLEKRIRAFLTIYDDATTFPRRNLDDEAYKLATKYKNNLNELDERLQHQYGAMLSDYDSGIPAEETKQFSFHHENSKTRNKIPSFENVLEFILKQKPQNVSSLELDDTTDIIDHERNLPLKALKLQEKIRAFLNIHGNYNDCIHRNIDEEAQALASEYLNDSIGLDERLYTDFGATLSGYDVGDNMKNQLNYQQFPPLQIATARADATTYEIIIAKLRAEGKEDLANALMVEYDAAKIDTKELTICKNQISKFRLQSFRQMLLKYQREQFRGNEIDSPFHFYANLISLGQADKGFCNVLLQECFDSTMALNIWKRVKKRKNRYLGSSLKDTISDVRHMMIKPDVKMYTLLLERLLVDDFGSIALRVADDFRFSGLLPDQRMKIILQCIDQHDQFTDFSNNNGNEKNDANWIARQRSALLEKLGGSNLYDGMNFAGKSRARHSFGDFFDLGIADTEMCNIILRQTLESAQVLFFGNESHSSTSDSFDGCPLFDFAWDLLNEMEMSADRTNLDTEMGLVVGSNCRRNRNIDSNNDTYQILVNELLIRGRTKEALTIADRWMNRFGKDVEMKSQIISNLEKLVNATPVRRELRLLQLIGDGVRGQNEAKKLLCSILHDSLNFFSTKKVVTENNIAPCNEVREVSGSAIAMIEKAKHKNSVGWRGLWRSWKSNSNLNSMSKKDKVQKRKKRNCNSIHSILQSPVIFELDIELCNTIIRSCKSGDDAFALLEIMKRGAVESGLPNFPSPNVETYNSVLLALSVDYCRTEAEILLKELRENVDIQVNHGTELAMDPSIVSKVRDQNLVELANELTSGFSRKDEIAYCEEEEGLFPDFVTTLELELDVENNRRKGFIGGMKENVEIIAESIYEKKKKDTEALEDKMIKMLTQLKEEGDMKAHHFEVLSWIQIANPEFEKILSCLVDNK